MRFTKIAMLSLVVVGAALGAFTLAAPERKASPRSFDFVYSAEIANIPKGARTVAVWVPYPVTDPNQKIDDVEVKSPVPATIEQDADGNSVLYFALENPTEPSLAFEMSFRVKRDEYVRKDFAKARGKLGRKERAELAQYLKADKLVPLDERIRGLSAEVVKGKKTDLDKARAIYDYVVANMKYDKSGTGWGNGDIYWACDAKRGNCTDFHALFIGLGRAAGIPARFSIGFPLPSERGEGEIGGYHCWAEFYVHGYGWIPVDTSEAAKNPAKREYFFGAHDENRVQLSTGRDLVLTPAQKGDPLNFFVYPYVEVDGKAHKDLTKKFRFKDA
jgi:transglutaminase-like putative cysteine protease